MQILGIANSYASAPVNAPTSLSAVAAETSVAISFTAPTNDGGAEITNYEYNIDGGSFVALSPADATSPITISGLTPNTSTTITLRAVNIVGSGPASTGVTFSTLPVFMSATGGTTFDYTSGGFTYRSHTFTSNGSFVVSNAGSFGVVDIHLIGGGGGGGYSYGGGGGGGGTRTEANAAISATTYSVTIGGAGYQGQDIGSGWAGGAGGRTTIGGFTVGGGGAGTTNVQNGAGAPADGGGGGGGNLNGIGASANGSYGSPGGGANSQSGANGGSGYNQPNSYRTGSNETRALGGYGSPANGAGAPAGGTSAGCGGGGGGIFNNVPYRGGNAVAGIVIVRYRIA